MSEFEFAVEKPKSTKRPTAKNLPLIVESPHKKGSEVEPDILCSLNCTPLIKLLGIKQCWFVADVCGLICAIFTWLLILYAEFAASTVALPLLTGYSYYVNSFLYHLFSLLATVSHIKAMFSNPGAIPLGNATKENVLKMGFREGQIVYKCPKCSCIKPERAHHCSICRRCIQKMDHHCPWVNNCVGEKNQKFFILFTLYICLMSIHSLYLAISYFVSCIGSDWKSCESISYFSTSASSLILIFLIFEGVFFGLFTAVMFGDQVRAVIIDETGIESLKGEQPRWQKKSKWLLLELVFGYPFSWRWFSPFSAPSPPRKEPHLYVV